MYEDPLTLCFMLGRYWVPGSEPGTGELLGIEKSWKRCGTYRQADAKTNAGMRGAEEQR